MVQLVCNAGEGVGKYNETVDGLGKIDPSIMVVDIPILIKTRLPLPSQSPIPIPSRHDALAQPPSNAQFPSDPHVI